jgi:flagellar biosynthesis/type III secretory pathway chaperone
MQMISGNTSDHLHAVLDEQIECAESMLSTLGQEHATLRSGDAEQLNEVSAGKARLADKLEHLEAERQGLADALNISFASATNCGADQKWNRLLSVLEQCQHQNSQNGSLVQARRTQIESALSTLRLGEPGSYDAAGNKRTMGASLQLGSA